MRKFPLILAIAIPIAMLFCAIGATAFIRPYDVPEFIEVDSSESAF